MASKTRSRRRRAVPLAGGQHLTVEPGPAGDRLTLRAADGRVSLTIHVTADGPVLRFDGPGVTIEAAGHIALEADRIALHGRREVCVTSGGDVNLDAAGEVQAVARGHEVVATHGNVTVHANDDVRMTGERILMNC